MGGIIAAAFANLVQFGKVITFKFLATGKVNGPYKVCRMAYPEQYEGPIVSSAPQKIDVGGMALRRQWVDTKVI